ncbi:hypothetical protein K1719_042044 [Acacia pycnantha]|nr:hypothetical protein K1719_042044 [Acacia pycnantha]
MELTKINRLSPHPSVLAGTSCVSKDSNDMSIVGENPRRYDYFRLSPSIEAMLEEGSEDFLASPELDSTGSGFSKPSKASLTRHNNNGVRSPLVSAMNDAPKHEMSGDNTVSDTATNQIQSSDSTIKETISCLHYVIDQITLMGIKEFVKDSAGPAKKQLDFAAANMKSPPEVDDCLEVSTKHDLGYHYLNANQVKEINLKEAVHVSDIDHNQVDGNLIQGSTP